MKRWIVLPALVVSAFAAFSCTPPPRGSGGGASPSKPKGKAYTIRYIPGDKLVAKYDVHLIMASTDGDSKIDIRAEQTTESIKVAEGFSITESKRVLTSNLTGTYFAASQLANYKTHLNTPVKMISNDRMQTVLTDESAAYHNVIRPGTDFPEKPVYVGDTWKATVELADEEPEQVPVKLAAVEQVKDQEVLRIEYGPMPVSGGVTDGPMVVWVDAKTGIVQKAEAKFKFGTDVTYQFVQTIK